LEKSRPTDGQIDFSNFELTIKHYIDKFKATKNQIVKAMVSVQAQLDKGAIIMDSKAYFEKTLTQVMQEDDFRSHFV